MSFFEKLKNGLEKTKSSIFGQVNNLFKAFVKVDEDLLEELEELLIAADVGFESTEEIIEKLREKIKDERLSDAEETKAALIEILKGMIGEGEQLNLSTTPAVILVIGVNGVGKTTSIAKIAHHLISSGKKVVLAAGDTFRAAAIDQLQIWADRAGADLIKNTEGSDPAAVVFDAVSAAKSRKADVLIIDTAGRLHNKKNLMDELAKIDRVIGRELPDAARETLLVLDSTTGQNAVRQAKEFKNSADITGLVLTKLDGTAKGGVVVGIVDQFRIPIKFVGIGEGIDDLKVFNKREFVGSLFSKDDIS
jgi:fused signal recognition particle receptor